MTRRLTTWLAAAALTLQPALPAMASARAVDDLMLICTSAGLVPAPGQALPLGADRSGLKHGACHAICQCCGDRRRHPTRRR